MWSTGFYTSKFGIPETFLLYLSITFGIVTTTARWLFSRKNLARFFDIFGSALFTIALAWLFVIFPFNFTHFADVLPNFLRFLLQWISNDIARILMALGLIVSPIMAIYNAILYVFVRRELSKQT